MNPRWCTKKGCDQYGGGRLDIEFGHRESCQTIRCNTVKKLNYNERADCC
jgi:hypothetical protein